VCLRHGAAEDVATLVQAGGVIHESFVVAGLSGGLLYDVGEHGRTDASHADEKFATLANTSGPYCAIGARPCHRQPYDARWMA
jgi:hypothetical protein